MAYDGFSFLTRGEDGIWRRRNTASRPPRKGEDVNVSVTTYPGGGSAYTNRKFMHATLNLCMSRPAACPMRASGLYWHGSWQRPQTRG